MKNSAKDRKLKINNLTSSNNYKAFVGPIEKYDVVGAMQFNLLTFLGLRENHYLLDIGCGSLRGGRLFIPYLLPGHYFGIEPEKMLIKEGIKNELGNDIIKIKSPKFSCDKNFTCTLFKQNFDYILAQSIFSHASRNQIIRCINQAKKCMTPTSIFAATFLEGEDDYFGNVWVYPNCVTYTLSSMIGMAEKLDLLCIPIDWPHPNEQKWVLIVHPENEKNIPDISDTLHKFRLLHELNFYKESYLKLKHHPYVRFGTKINGIVKRIKQII